MRRDDCNQHECWLRGPWLLQPAFKQVAVVRLSPPYRLRLGARCRAFATPHSESGLTREQAIAHEGRFFEEGYA
jgi:hypothetical protein